MRVQLCYWICWKVKILNSIEIYVRNDKWEEGRERQKERNLRLSNFVFELGKCIRNEKAKWFSVYVRFVFPHYGNIDGRKHNACVFVWIGYV